MSIYKRKVPLEQGKWIFYVWTSQFFSFRLTWKKFSNCPKLSRNFPTAQNCPKKRKILYLIKLVSKGQEAIRKRHTDFLAFNFGDLKLVSINLELNSAAETLTFLKNVSTVSRKVCKLENLGWMSLVTYRRRTGKCCN